MTTLTAFLLVLIISLVIGNALLFFVKRAAPKSRQSLQAASIREVIPQAIDFASQDTQEQAMQAQSKIMALERKVELAHMRLHSLERAPLVSGEGESDFATKRKIEKLENFRSTAESEIIAMKEILAELQNRHITVKARTYKPAKKVADVSDDDLHKLVYRSSSG